jgi:hypothetical protein
MPATDSSGLASFFNVKGTARQTRNFLKNEINRRSSKCELYISLVNLIKKMTARITI